MSNLAEIVAPKSTPPPPQKTGWSLFGIPFHRKIYTGEKQVPWSAVFILSLMWFNFGFHIFAGGQALTFTIQHYNKDPRIISLITTFTAVIMFSPLISYLSDQIWTRFGRRRPFLLVAWTGGCIGMLSFAFLPQVCGAINGALGFVGIPPIADIILLTVIVGCYKKMLDGMAPMEPLFLECVPPQQRGRFWAIRGMLFTLAVMFFYQILWPVFDDRIDMFGYLGHPGVLFLKGEQLVYLFASGLFFITGLYLTFCVEETRMPTAPNRSLREMFLGSGGTNAPTPVAAGPQPVSHGFMAGRFMAGINRIPIVAFLASFCKDVFLKVSNYPFYIILVIPGMEAAVWGPFGALMQNDQFGYSKPNQALWAFPIGLLSMCCLTPFAGWYSDVRVNVKRWLRVVLLFVSAACFSTMVFMYRRYLPTDIAELPEFWVLVVITVLTAGGVSCLYVPMVETMLDLVGREHARAWVALLTIFKSIINTVALYFWIRSCANHVPPILSWMVFGVIGASMGTLMDTFIGPMIYDYMPRSRMGTINSGVGIYNAVLGFIIANIGAWWVVFFSRHFVAQVSGTLKYDYTSIYLVQFVLFVPAILAKVFFIRMILKGRIKKWGVIEVEGAK